jgi:hypothetical protein
LCVPEYSGSEPRRPYRDRDVHCDDRSAGDHGEGARAKSPEGTFDQALIHRRLELTWRAVPPSIVTFESMLIGYTDAVARFE